MGTTASRGQALLGLALACLLTPAAPAAELKLLLPLGRTAYQTNEWIDVSVLRQATQPLSGGDLTLHAAGADGSRLSFTFPVPAVPVEKGTARRTEHLHLDGRLLRPGHYTLEASADDATAKAEVDVFSHLRKSSFKLVSWGRATKEQQLVEGADGLGFNLFYGNPSGDDAGNFIRAGVDFMSNCTMGGGHQMDLRIECDWSDPYVIRGGTRRAVRRAFLDRTKPNVLGIHFYDEPGLTWHNHPKTGEYTPHGIPAQVRAYRNAFGREPIPYNEVRPDRPEDAARWRHWALWKLGFLDAAWKDASFAVSFVRPDYLSATQSQYGWSAFTDGYYFNVTRSLPVISGHGGYDDFGLGYFNPSYFLEMGRARDQGRPCWYLPTWYGNTPADRFRLEQYLSFMTNIQGLITPPDIDPFEPATKPAAEAVVETNHALARLGPIFTTMPVTKPPVAMLYSLSDSIHAQTLDRKVNYTHATKQGEHLPYTYLAGKMLHEQFLPIVEEDVLDGTLAANHKAVVLTSLDYLDPKVAEALGDFASHGGLVLLTGDCKVQVNGAINVGAVGELPDAAKVRQLVKEDKNQEAAKYQTVGKFFAGAAPLARALRAQFEKADIHPILECDQPQVVVTRQAAGDIEYLFVVNATFDPAGGGPNAVRATTATLGVPADGRPVYDALLGGGVSGLQQQGQSITGTFRFGPGEMKVLARTARPIGRVQALTPAVRRDFTRTTLPVAVEVGAVLRDTQGGVLSGSAPLEVLLLDPLDRTRYDLYRATKDGSLRLALPLAANDPPGRWKVVVRDLLGNTEDAVSFSYTPAAQCGALAGATERAVSFGDDRNTIFRFFRLHQDVTVVVGSSAHDEPAARRLAEAVRPWGVRCKLVKAAEVNHPREVTAEEAPTLVGLEPGKAKPGKDNPVSIAGFAVTGPVVLLGSPQDNPPIAFVQQQKFLPYQPDPVNFPGRGRALLAWQRDAIGAGQESVTLIAYDADGMSEGVGTLAEAASGLEPLTRFAQPRTSGVLPATLPARAEEAPVAWQVRLSDRAIALRFAGGKLTILTWDGTLVELDADGRLIQQQFLKPDNVEERAKELRPKADVAAVRAAQKQAPAGRVVKLVASGPFGTAVAYWGGALRVVRPDGSVRAAQQLPQDVVGLAWMDGRLVAALANGEVLALSAR
jgi:hypothetical protein